MSWEVGAERDFDIQDWLDAESHDFDEKTGE
jgi:hypothetical protein